MRQRRGTDGCIRKRGQGQRLALHGGGPDLGRGQRGIASGTQEVSSSIAEISQNAHHATDVVRDAITSAESASATVDNLVRQSDEIDAVMRLITSIAQQTNLLALNATIEAARAGEAGRGFAVVAGEVKELATSAAKASEEVGQKVSAIQQEAREAIGAIERILGVTGDIHDVSQAIATAVTQQSAGTDSIAKSLELVAHAGTAISRSIEAVDAVAARTHEHADAASQASADLNDIAMKFGAAVSHFRI